jgi:cyclopropane fatty-acyl-phospholipid synthase-like methyltransferase
MRALQGFVVLTLGVTLGSGCSTIGLTPGEVPFVATPMDVVDRMLEIAQVKKGDTVYDLGSGDGRIVIRAAKRHGAKGVGVEIDSDLVERSRFKARDGGVGHLVEFWAEDALTVDVSRATVVTLYMLPEFNAKLRPILQRQLKAGARVVSHDFEIEGWKPSQVEKMRGRFLHQHTIYLWRIEE